VNKQTAKLSTSGIAIFSLLHGYSRQRTIRRYLYAELLTMAPTSVVQKV